MDFLVHGTHCDGPLMYTVGIIYTICSDIKNTFTFFFGEYLIKFCMILIIISYFREKHLPFGFCNVVGMNSLPCGCAVVQAVNCQPCHRDPSSLPGQSEMCGG